jgi:hypothetical protein
MPKLAAIAFLPVASLTFGILLVLVLSVPSATSGFARGAWLIYGAAALSLALAVPIAWLVAHRMLTRRERRLLNAGAGTGAAIAQAAP